MRKLQQRGIIDLRLVVAVALILGIGGFAFWRVSQSSEQNRSSDLVASEQTEALPENLDNLKTLADIEQIAGVSDTTKIVGFVLEGSGDNFVYKVTLSSGRKLVINAANGEIISDETTSLSDDDKAKSAAGIKISPADAYRIAAAQSSSPVKKIELEVEDRRVTYKVELKDGSKIEIDAVSGSIIKAEVKDRSGEDDEDSEDRRDGSDDEAEDEEDEPEQEDEDESDDNEDEDEDEQEDEDEAEDEDESDDD